MSLKTRETDFCNYYVVCRNSREAAARAGFAFPERTGIRLLAKKEVIEEIERIVSNDRIASSAVDGLRRIAFGSVADAVKLLLGDVPDELEELDLFMVSEIKRSPNGGMEIKFYDRIKALDALLEAGDGRTDAKTPEFVDAIFKGSAAINGLLKDESDEI